MKPIRCKGPGRNSGSSNPHPGEIWWVGSMEFADSNEHKDRPILVMGCEGDSVVYRKCTSQHSDFRERYAIMDLISAGLDKDTYIDLETLRISKKRLNGYLGTLCDEDWENLKN